MPADTKRDRLGPVQITRKFFSELIEGMGDIGAVGRNRPVRAPAESGPDSAAGSLG